jgi:hypothetical protein
MAVKIISIPCKVSVILTAQNPPEQGIDQNDGAAQQNALAGIEIKSGGEGVPCTLELGGYVNHKTKQNNQ